MFYVIYPIVVSYPASCRAFFEVEQKSEGGITIQVVSMEAFTSQESETLVELHGSRVSDFCLESDLPDNSASPRYFLAFLS